MVRPYFKGACKGSADATMLDFERAACALCDGYHLSWDGLLALASGIEQARDCLVVGSRREVPVQRDVIEENGFPGCDYVINAFDEAEWTIGTNAQQFLRDLEMLMQIDAKQL